MPVRTIVAMIAGTILLQSCGSSGREPVMADEVIPVTVMQLAQDSLQPEITAAGQFTTDDETQLSFKNGGVVQAIYVKEGDAVRQGQLLARLNATEINAMAEQASLALQKAQRDYERANNLYKDSVATLEQLQNAKTVLDAAKQQYSSAGFNQAYAEIRATKSGFVLRRFANEGQVVGPGTPVLMINGAAQGKWLLKAGVSDYQWSLIKTGDKAAVTTDAMPGKIFPGTVTKKSEGLDPVSGTFFIQVQISDVPKDKIASGLFGKATITPSHTINAWAVPYDALLDGDAGSGYVFVTNDDSTARKIQVQVDKIEKGKVIISKGLEQVRALIVSGSAYLNEGSKIKVVVRK